MSVWDSLITSRRWGGCMRFVNNKAGRPVGRPGVDGGLWRRVSCLARAAVNNTPDLYAVPVKGLNRIL